MTEPNATVDFYWRPGCGFCMMLDRRLSKAGIADRAGSGNVAITGSRFVRSVARGNETVPTVVVGDQAMVNPSAKQVLAALATA